MFFESIFTSTIVIFISSCAYRSFVNKAFRKVIASFGGRWCWIFHNFRNMFPDDIIDVRHTTVPYFDVIFVE